MTASRSFIQAPPPPEHDLDEMLFLSAEAFCASFYPARRVLKITAACLTALGVAATLSSCASATAPSATSATSSATSAPPSPTATPTPTPTPSAFTVSTFATCAQLAGTKQDGPLYQYISTITSSHATDAANIDKLRTLQTQLMGVADHADPKMKQLIENLWSTNVSDFKAAGVELVTECH